MKLDPDAMQWLLKAVRKCPDHNADAAWKFAADCLRHLDNPTTGDARQCARLIINHFAANHWQRLERVVE